MSAVVTIPDPENGPCDHSVTAVDIPAGNAYSIDQDGRLIVKTASHYNAETAGVFKEWHYIVITPVIDRGPDGRFVKRVTA